MIVDSGLEPANCAQKDYCDRDGEWQPVFGEIRTERESRNLPVVVRPFLYGFKYLTRHTALAGISQTPGELFPENCVEFIRIYDTEPFRKRSGRGAVCARA